MTMWQRVLFAVVIMLTHFPLFVFVVGMAAWLPYPVTTIALGAMVIGWLAVLIAREIVRPAKPACSVAAVTAAHALCVAIITGLVGPSNINESVLRFMVIGGLLLQFIFLVTATYWRGVQAIRMVETSLALFAWLLVLVLRVSDRWRFDLSYGHNRAAVEEYRIAGGVLLVATAPLLVALLVAYWRDRDLTRSTLDGAAPQ